MRLLPWHERRHAARASDDPQALYRTVKADHPDWGDRELYKRVVMARAGCDSRRRFLTTCAFRARKPEIHGRIAPPNMRASQCAPRRRHGFGAHSG
jgi:hypothetical protein